MPVPDEKIFEQINRSLLDLKNKPGEQSNLLTFIDQVVQMNKIVHQLFERLEELHEQVNGGTDGYPLKEFSSILSTHSAHLANHDDHLNAHDRHLGSLTEELGLLKKHEE
jgi:hypothetical protein